jgi:hypothetical protein
MKPLATAATVTQRDDHDLVLIFSDAAPASESRDIANKKRFRPGETAQAESSISATAHRTSHSGPVLPLSYVRPSTPN